MQSHPYYNEWKNLTTPYTPFNSGYNINNDTTSAETYNGLHSINSNYRYVAFSPENRYNMLMSNNSIELMSRMITDGLKGVHPEGKRMIVPDSTIRSVADSIYETSNQNANIMQKMVINYIINWIKNEYETIEKNNTFDIWNTKYDLDSDLQQTNGIKLNNKQRHWGTMWNY